MKNVLITGVSTGLGRGLAEAYLERGFAVFGCSRNAPTDLIERGLNYQSIDLASGEEAVSDFRELIRDTKTWECIYLNAGKLGEIRDMKDSPLTDLRETMEINVWANKWILDSLFEESKTVSQVIGISSGASHSGSRGWNGYSLSKAALNMLIKLYSGERTNTHFTSLAPGLVDSGMQDYLTNLPADERFKPLEILKEAKGTDKMPDGRTCAEMILKAIPKILQVESGSFTDIRKL